MHVDLPFHNDPEVGVVEHVFSEDVARTLEEFRSDLYSASFDTRRLGFRNAARRVFQTVPTERGDRMYGLTRAGTTLLAGGAAGLLIWFATQIDDQHVGGFWAVYGLIAGAGLLMALSQLLGGWTKWGMPRLSAPFLLTAFVPIAIVSLWIILAAEPGTGWFHRHVLSWSGDLHIRGSSNDLQGVRPGVRVRHRPRVRLLVRHDRPAQASPAGDHDDAAASSGAGVTRRDGADADEPVTRDRVRRRRRRRSTTATESRPDSERAAPRHGRGRL
jgi:hypothetical protein